MVESVSIRGIAAIISRNHKGLQFELDDIGQWCGECIEEMGVFESLVKETDVPVKMSNGLGALPCNVYRVLHVKTGDCIPDYLIDAPYIRIKGFNGTVKVDYLGIPLDEEGYPKIDASARQACYWYCYKKLRTDDYYNGKIHPNAWADIEKNEIFYMTQAKGSMRNMTRDDMNGLSAIMHNMTRGVIMPKSIK